nr:pyridoxal kinase [Ahrensia sp. R2A130]
MTGATQGAVIVISSHVVRGTVGNRAAVFALETLGFPVWAMPTVTLPWHPGHGPASRIIADDAEFAALLADLAKHPKLGEVAGIVTGYFGSAGQVAAVAELVDAVKAANPQAIYLCDPVMGDVVDGEGRLYVPQAQADAIVRDLLPRADWVTPNPFELSILSGDEIATAPETIAVSAKKLARDTVVVTSVPALRRGHIGNLLLRDGQSTVVEHRAVETHGRPLNGLGDLASALLLGRSLSGVDAKQALGLTCASLHEVMAISAQAGSDELLLESAAQSLLRPRSPVETRSLSVVRKAPKRKPA